MSFFYEGTQRLDWGFGNPNRTAALIAMLMVASWAIAYFHRRGFWPSLLLFSVFGGCLVQTFSRGGMVALALGSLPLIVAIRRPWPRWRLFSLLLVLVSLVVYAFFLSATDRIASSWQGDPSVLNRLTLWQHVPSMIADAPGGWGWGRSQTAYMNWYQPVDHPERFLNLVSLHFTLLAEAGWPLRFLYLFSWGGAFLVTWPRSRNPIPFAILLTFLIAGIFTHFASSWPIYSPPLIAIAYALVARWQAGDLPSRRHFFTVGSSALAGCIFFFALGRLTSTLPIRGNPEYAILGKGSPAVWLLVEPKVLGNDAGKALRRTWQASNDPSIALISNLAALPDHVPFLVLSMIDQARFTLLKEKAPHALLLLNSPAYPVEVSQILPGSGATAVFGEFSQSASLASWQKLPGTQVISGVGDYLPGWPQIVLTEARKQ